ncbi:DUF4190 domain-containing protein [Demequina sp. NBRC 110051]|uniref:DUF4190 domain-containing protein n=1 Tax=Demequina sp. NBRC 110051 TaxID=1570340 RepID=UPI001180A284|nr:DUF4190 domain-containing protein [Demequina sp. NBRC 110051]
MTDNTQQPQPEPEQPQQPQQPQYAAPQYTQPSYGAPQYAQAGYAPGPRPGTEKNWMNITSLALSLGGLVTGITVIPGIIFGHLGLSAAKRGEADNRSLGLAGLITGYVILALGLLVLIAVLVFAGAFVGELVQECTGDNPAEWCTDTSSNNAWTAVTGIPA